jgi:short-subunit dehydrogenase involved in D-alanine esterification of teichoic acids
MTSATTPVSGQREPELAARTVVVFGGSPGIGLETRPARPHWAADVIIAGRVRVR